MMKCIEPGTGPKMGLYVLGGSSWFHGISNLIIGVGRKLFGVLVLLWLWRFAKEDEHFWLGQFD